MAHDNGFNIHRVFRAISKKLAADFEASAEIKHSGGKGAVRETSIWNFLGDYLPQRYALGNGEVIHWSNHRSRQCDIIIHDRYRCPRLLANDDHSIFPLESVYGIIEVKSTLTSEELEKAVENIASVKRLVPQGTIAVGVGGSAVSSLVMGVITGVARPIPFGGIVAYGADRSLEAIRTQLMKLEGALSDKRCAPDSVVILDKGIVSRKGPARMPPSGISTEWLSRDPVVRKTGQHTLLRFYLETLRELNTIELEELDLQRYIEMPELVDGHHVSGHNRAVWLSDGRPVGPVRKLGPNGINKIVAYCKSRGPTTMREHLTNVAPGPVSFEEFGDRFLEQKVYEYNPFNRKAVPSKLSTNENAYCPMTITVDDEDYFVDSNALDEEDFLENEDMTFDDLFNS